MNEKFSRKKYFFFIGKDNNNLSVSGTIDAPNKKIARHILFFIGIKKIRVMCQNFIDAKKVFRLNAKEKEYFFSNFNILLSSGMPLLSCLEIIQAETHVFKIKYICYLISKEIQEGHSLSQAIKKLPYSSFSSIEMSLIHLAEISGNLDQSLNFIQKRLKKLSTIKQKIISALIYPCITLFASFIIMFAIFYWVIPEFSALFSLHQRQLPWITSIILNCSHHIKKIYGLILLIIAIIFLISKYGVAYNFFSIKIYETCINKTPLIGKILKNTNQIHFCFSMFILLKSGIPIHSAFKECIGHVTLPYSKQELHKALNNIMHGKSVSHSLKKTKFLPYSAIQTINSAENTGRLDNAFHSLYERLSDELNQFADRAGKTIEPFIIILLGGMIGIIVIAIYLPIFQLGSLY